MTQCPGCGADWVPADTAFRLADQDARIAELEATNHHLVDALEAIAMMQTKDHEGCPIADEMRKAARQALEGKK